MSNRINRVEIRNLSLTPAQAEVGITVHAEMVTPATEVRGRLMGPSCPYSKTIEVAYPLRPLAQQSNSPPLTMRVVIPEASWWEPESPFLYRGPIELWQDGQRCDRVVVQHGLASSVLSPRGLRWNGKLLQLRGQRVRGLTSDTAMSLRQAGLNLLIAAVNEPETWNIADRLGFLVIGELSSVEQEALTEQISAHPSCLGWLIDEATTLAKRPRGPCGIVLTTPAAIPAWAAFGICAPDQAARFAESRLPLFLV